MLKNTFLLIFLLLSSCSGVTPSRLPATLTYTNNSKASCAQLLRYSLSKPDYLKHYLDFSKFEVNSFYKIILEKTTFIDDAQLLFVKTNKNAERVYSFSQKRRSIRGNLTNEEIQIIDIPESKITGFSKKSKSDLDNIGFQDIDFYKYVEHLYNIYSSKLISVINKYNIEILIKDKSISSAAKRVHSIVKSHIEFYKKYGFKAPSTLQVILDHKSTQSPFAIPGKMTRIKGDKKFNTIVLTALNHNKNALFDESIIRHELTHIMLQEYFNKESFINSSNTFQEALADFFGANIIDSPKIGGRYNKDSPSIRNIETLKGKDNIKMNIMLDIEGNRYHDSSVIFSNILWNLRTILGEDINKTLLPLLNDLNNYYDSYKKYLGKYKKNNDEDYLLSSLIYDDIYFFLSVLLKRKWKKDKEDKIYEFLEKYIDINQLSFSRVIMIGENLHINPIDHKTAQKKHNQYFDSFMKILIQRHKQ